MKLFCFCAFFCEKSIDKTKCKVYTVIWEISLYNCRKGRCAFDDIHLSTHSLHFPDSLFHLLKEEGNYKKENRGGGPCRGNRNESGKRGRP